VHEDSPAVHRASSVLVTTSTVRGVRVGEETSTRTSVEQPSEPVHTTYYNPPCGTSRCLCGCRHDGLWFLSKLCAGI